MRLPTRIGLSTFSNQIKSPESTKALVPEKIITLPSSLDSLKQSLFSLNKRAITSAEILSVPETPKNKTEIQIIPEQSEEYISMDSFQSTPKNVDLNLSQEGLSINNDYLEDINQSFVSMRSEAIDITKEAIMYNNTIVIERNEINTIQHNPHPIHNTNDTLKNIESLHTVFVPETPFEKRPSIVAEINRKAYVPLNLNPNQPIIGKYNVNYDLLLIEI